MCEDVFARGWWLLLLRGMVAGLLGLLILSWPRLSLATLALLFALYTLVDGGSTLIGARLKRTVCADWRLARMQGLAGVAIGCIVIGHPGISASFLLIQGVLRAAAIGSIDGLAALILLEQTRREWLLLLCGIAPALAGALVLTRLGTGPLAAHWYLAASSITASALLLALVFRIQRHRER